MERQGTIFAEGSGVIVAGRDGVICSVNDATCAIFGYSAGELVGQKINVLMPHPLAEQHDHFLEHYFASGVFQNSTSRIVFGITKRCKPVKVRLCLAHMQSGDTPLISAMIDRVLEHSFLLTTDAHGEILAVQGNPMATCGYSEAELLGANVSMLCPASIRPHAASMQDYVPGQSSLVVGHVRNRDICHANGQPMTVALEVHQNTGIPTTFSASITEIELSAMITVDSSHHILSVDASCALMFGYEETEMLGLPLSALSRHVPLKEGRRIVLWKHSDGSHFFVSVDVKPFMRGHEPSYCLIIRRRLPHNAPRQRSLVSVDDDNVPMNTLLPDWYEILGKELGNGLCGSVRRATHRLTGIEVAIKTLNKAQFVALKMPYPPRELELLKKLRHPHICQLLHPIVREDAVLLVMELVLGGELLDYVGQRECLPETMSRHFMRQIVDAVDYMHRCGVVHRDLKLENILVDADDNVKIIDLGLGQVYSMLSKEMLTTWCGSVDYAPPEIWLQQPYDGPAADLWALGVLLYIMATGFVPFSTSSDTVKMSFRWPRCPYSPELRHLVGRLLCAAKDRANMTEVITHPWMTENGHVPLILDRAPHQRPSDLNEDILAQMENLGLPRESARIAILNEDYSQLSVTYTLIEQKMLKQKKAEYVQRRLSQQLQASSPSLDSPMDARRGSNGDGCNLG
jgi:PAS domain S-box-containing protein